MGLQNVSGRELSQVHGLLSEVSKATFITILLIKLVLVLPLMLHASKMIRASAWDTEKRLQCLFSISQRILISEIWVEVQIKIVNKFCHHLRSVFFTSIPVFWLAVAAITG